MDTYSQHDPTQETRTWLLRLGAVAGLLFALSFGIPGIIEAFTGETTGTSLIVGVGVAAFGLPALFAFHVHQREAAGRFGVFAFAVNAIGLGLFAAGSFAFNLVLFFLEDSVSDAVLAGPTMWPVNIGGLIFIVGNILFAISMFRAGVMPRAAAVGYSVALNAIAVLGMLDDSLVSSFAHVVAAASLITLSAHVWRGTATSSQPKTRAWVAEPAPAA